MSEKSPSFEDKIQELERIAKELSKEDLLLEDGVNLYKQGVKLSKEASAMLENAQIIYEELSKDDKQD